MKIELFEGLSLSEYLASYVSRNVTMYLFTIIWVCAGLFKFINNNKNKKNWPIITGFFWVIAGITEILIGAAVWAAPGEAWISVYASYFMLGSILSFVAFIPDKQGQGGSSPMDRDGALVLLPTVIVFLLTNLFAFHVEVDPSKYRIFCLFAGIANAFSVNTIAMMIKKMNDSSTESREKIQ